MTRRCACGALLSRFTVGDACGPCRLALGPPPYRRPGQPRKVVTGPTGARYRWSPGKTDLPGGGEWREIAEGNRRPSVTGAVASAR